MAKKSTFVKIDRNILNWRWYTVANTFRVFIHLLLNANIKKYGFEGQEISRGQIATSYKSIALALNITDMQVRTAINHLKSTGEITSQSFNKFTVYTIVNYDLYQERAQASKQSNNNQVTIRQQSNNNQVTTIKESKECKNVRSKDSKGATPTLSELRSFIGENGLNVNAEKFYKHYTDNGWTTESGKQITDWKRVAIAWHKRALEPLPVYANGYAGIKRLNEK